MENRSSLPPAFSLPATRFGERLVRWNRLDAAGFAGWEFLPGMKFAERAAWWRGGAERDVAHEGLDICRYRTADGSRRSLGAGALVPAAFAGVVVAIVEDFLGRSVFVAHDIHDGAGLQLHTVYGHLDPRPELQPGSSLGEEDPVGTIAHPIALGNRIPPHLHLTAALIRRGGHPERLTWDALRERGRVLLLDPLPVVTAGRLSGNEAFAADFGGGPAIQ